MFNALRQRLNAPINLSRLRLSSTSTSPYNASSSAKNVLKVALVGRPNVGKSTLFNRLTGTRQAIVSPVPGTTRDRKEGNGKIAGLPIKVIDTGGLDDRGAVSQSIQQQVEQAILSADVILFLLDARAGVSSLDNHFAQWIRKKIGKVADMPPTAQTSSMKDAKVPDNNNNHLAQKITKTKDVLVLANKTEGGNMSDRVLDSISDAVQLGLGDPLLISSSHGDGMADLAQALIQMARNRGLEDGTSLTSRSSRSTVNSNSHADSMSSLQSDAESLSSSPASSDSLTTSRDNQGSKTNDEAITMEERVIQLAVMGRPNVGKSTLINAFVGQDRVITGPTPGLTRDAIHVEWNFKGRQFRLVDTAGLTRLKPNKRLLEDTASEKRKKMEIQDTVGSGFGLNAAGQINPKLLPGTTFMDPEEDPSQFSHQISELALVSALNALRFAQVVLLVVEGGQGKFSKIDLQLARKCLEEGRALVIAGNKKDLVALKGINTKEYEAGIAKHCESFMKEFGNVPVIACTASQGSGVNKILRAVIDTHDAWSRRVSTWVLNRWLKDLMIATPPPRVGGKSIVVRYMTQVKSRPPAFALFTNAPELPGSFQRFLRFKLQQDFQMAGVPIRFVVKKSVGNVVEKALLKQGKKTRRGVGRGEGRPVGPKRDSPQVMHRVKATQNSRRRRDSRLNRVRNK